MQFIARIMIAAGCAASIAGVAAAQDGGRPTVKSTPAPVRTPVETVAPNLSDTLAKNVANIDKNSEVPREKRVQAYAKLLEGQRHVWAAKRSRSQAAVNSRLARQAFQRAVELDPTLAEGYTALAELAWNFPPNDVEESIRLAKIAIAIEKNNFGANRLLGRAYTLKSRLNRGTTDPENAQNAIQYWKETARLDSRYAEAWAFLSALYPEGSEEQIAALRGWLSSAAPIDTYFYRVLMGGQADLAPENAAVKLGKALLAADRVKEAVDVLNQVIVDDPESEEALELLRSAIDVSDPAVAQTSIQAIKQAIYANPGDTELILLLAKVQARVGNSADTTKFLNDTIARYAEQDKSVAAGLQAALGDVYREAGRFDEAIQQFNKSLVTRGISPDRLATDDDRDFAVAVFEKIVLTYKTANRFAEAKAAIINSEKILGDEDSFADRQLIALYRESGKRAEALQAVKMARVRFPDDYGFLRTEAMVLVELGRADEGVGLIRSLIGKQDPKAPSIMYDDFSNFLYISILYSEARRGKDAIAAANEAIAVSQDPERKQIALLSLATAQNVSKDFAAAESTLRGILKQTPKNPIALNNLGYFLADRNEKLEEALKLIQEALEIDPGNPSFLDSLGWAYFKLGKYDLAAASLIKALKADPASATAHHHLGDVYEKQGKIESARQSWQRALVLAVDPVEIAALKSKLSVKKPK